MGMPDYTPQDLADKICHVLSVYPQISPSMLQIALNVSAPTWKPILEDLIDTGKVERKHTVSPTPTGRHQTYTILSLNGGSEGDGDVKEQ